MSEVAVHRPCQAWHNVHTLCLCPLRGWEAFRTVFGLCGNSPGDKMLRLMSEGSLGNSMPSWKDPAQSFRGTGSCRRDTRVCLESGASEDSSHWRVCFLPSGTGQDFHRKSRKNVGQSFYNQQRPRRKYQSQVGSCVLCSRKAGKGTFLFPVDLIYTRCLCNCHWERRS